MGQKTETCMRCGLPLTENDDWLWAGGVCAEGQRLHRRCPVTREREARAWDAAEALRTCSAFAMTVPPSGEPWNALAARVETIPAIVWAVPSLDAVIADVRAALEVERKSKPDSIDGMRLVRARDALALLRVVLPRE